MLYRQVKREVSKPDVLVGVLLLLTGVTASMLALAFDRVSRVFPLTIGAALAAVGIGIVVTAILATTDGDRVNRHLARVFLAAAVTAVWALLLLGGGGFVVPTLAMQASLLVVTGMRRPIYVASIAALVTLLAWLFFVVLLDVPLPPADWFSTLTGA